MIPENFPAALRWAATLPNKMLFRCVPVSSFIMGQEKEERNLARFFGAEKTEAGWEDRPSAGAIVLGSLTVWGDRE